ncbi:MAG: hypothetical protein U0Q18_21005 [Bryobacteraceae bacterium]
MKPANPTRASHQTLLHVFLVPVVLRWLLVLTLAYVALATLPPAWKSYGTGLDGSWVLGLNLAHARGMVPGSDIVFSYGPLGYLTYPDPVSGTPVLALLWRFGLYGLFIAVISRLVWIQRLSTAAFWTPVLFCFAVVLDPLPEQSQGLLSITAAGLLILLDRSRWRWLEAILLAFLVGLECLVKLNQGVEATAIFIALSAAVVFDSRPWDAGARLRWTGVFCALPLSIVALFWTATGSPLALAGYMRTGWEVASGYSEAMGLPGPLWQVLLACATMAATFGIILLASRDVRALLPGLVPALLVAFFAFKHAMVRQDGHAALFYVKFAPGLLFLYACARIARDRRLIVGAALSSFVLAYAILTTQFRGFDVNIRDRLELRRVVPALVAAWHWRATWDNLGAAERSIRRKLRLPARFHDIVGNGTVDAQPWDVDVIEANGWRWQPRPVFQSYSACTPLLDWINAHHTESERTADFVLLNFMAIDGRHPFLEAPLSWRALFDRYDLEFSSAGWFLLQRRPERRYGVQRILAVTKARWDEDISIPEGDGLLFMGPKLMPSLAGRLKSTFFRSVPVDMIAVFGSGKTARWRCVPRSLGAGFLIRPFPHNLEDLRPIFVPGLPNSPQDRVRSVRFHAGKPDEYAPEIAIEWSAPA